MSGDCDKCGEHALECKCGLNTVNSIPISSKINLGIVGYIPYGFRLHEDGMHLEADKDEQYNLKLMRQMKIDGKTLREIADEMNFYKRFNRKGAWNHVSVHRVSKIERQVM